MNIARISFNSCGVVSVSQENILQDNSFGVNIRSVHGPDGTPAETRMLTVGK